MSDEVIQNEAPVEAWYKGQPDEVVGYLQNKKWDGADGPIRALESYRNLEKLHGVGPDRLLKLPETADEKGWSDVYDRLGRPKTAAEYKADGLKIPDGVTISEQEISDFTNMFHAAGLTQKQRDAIMNGYFEKVAAVQGATSKETEQVALEQLGNLKRDWGKHYDERITLANKMLRSGLEGVVPEDKIPEIGLRLEQALGIDVASKLLANLASVIGEDKFHGEGSSERKFGYTREQAISDRVKLMNDVAMDKERLAMYNKGKGNDYIEMERLNRIITGVE